MTTIEHRPGCGYPECTCRARAREAKRHTPDPITPERKTPTDERLVEDVYAAMEALGIEDATISDARFIAGAVSDRLRAAGEREAQIRALADEWEQRPRYRDVYRTCADEARAALSGVSGPTEPKRRPVAPEWWELAP